MRLSLIVMASCFVSLSEAFAPAAPSLTKRAFLATSSSPRFMSEPSQKDHHVTTLLDTNDDFHKKYDLVSTFSKSAMTVFLSWLATTGVACADSPDWGIFEGRTGSILHPIFMGGLFGLSLYTAFLGFQWRRQRTLGDEISALKKQMPSLGNYKTIQEALDSGEMEAQEASLKAALPIEQEIANLTSERKELASQGNRDKHYNQGAWIAFIGTAFAIEGPLNTYARAGKLFPGPHLYAGAGLVFCWAAAVACVPFMQRGNDTARSLHIAANVSGLALFAWQVTTGIPILLKVIELTKWP